ncbi:MAG TPA: PKD domain-containing protein [Flavobacteriales bacterium]|nr:PKD domain-containing protein [Flavobacteriales bacterium]
MLPRQLFRYFLPIAWAVLLGGPLHAQCPELFDSNGDPSPVPRWVSCSGGNFTLLIASPNPTGAYTIDWGDGTPPMSGASLVPPQTVTHVYPAAVATYTVTFTEITSGCVVTGTVIMEKSTSASIQIPIGGLTQACAPQSLDFINSSTNTSPNTVFHWNFGDGTGWTAYPYTNLGQTLTHMYMPGTVGCETTVRLRAENICNTLQGGPSIATFNPIRIWDLDSAEISPSATLLCWPDNQVTYLNTTRRNCYNQGNIYQRYEYWNFGDYWGTGQDSIIDWTPWPPTFPHTIAYPGIGSYDVMLLDSNYCGIDTTYVTINIVPPPSVAVNANPTPVCAGELVNFTQTTSGGANYFQWDFDEGNGFQWTNAGNQSHIFNTQGVYNVSYTASIQGATAGCADTATVAVTVLPSPTAQFTLDQDAACTSLTVQATNTSVNAVSYLWDFGDGTTSTLANPPPHTYSSIGAYTITLTAINSQGCHNTTTGTVHVYAVPSPVIGAQNVCEGSDAQFADLTITEPGNPVQGWYWDLGDGTASTDQAPTHTYAASGTYTVTLTVTTPYCSGTGSSTITVEPKPVAGLTASPVAGCSPMSVQFANTSTGATNYIWQFGDGGSDNATDPVHTYYNAGTTDTVYTARLIAGTTFGCHDTTSLAITVAPTVFAMFTHNAVPGCAPLAVDFTNNSTGATSYLWDFGDGTTSTDHSPSHTYINTSGVLQIMTMQLTVSNWAGCSSSTQQQIIVYPAPHFTFSAQPDSGCSPLTVTFPSVIGAISYQWNFGDGSTGSGPTPQHTYINSTGSTVHYPVSLVATNAFGCTDSTSGTITVFASPTAQFTVGATSGCHPLAATLTNQSQGASSYHWSYGDGQSSDTTALAHGHTWYNFIGPGSSSYPVTLTAYSTEGCSSTSSTTVGVHPWVNAAFVVDSAGCSPLTPHFVNLSTGATSYLWTFGDGSGSLSTNPSHTYSHNGLSDTFFHPVLIASSPFGCSDTATAAVLVHPAPIAQVTASSATGCAPSPITFHDLSIGAATLNWQFGDGTFQNGGPGDVTHIFNNTGTAPQPYNVQLIATSAYGCTDTTTTPITIYPPVQAQFQLPAEACSPAQINLMEQSTGSIQAMWDMGDGITLVGTNVSHTYLNTGNTDVTYTVTLTATSAYGCTSTMSHDITIHPLPSASFLATPFTQLFPDATVTLDNTTPPGSWGYSWSFGDGSSSTAQSPLQHTYSTWGNYTITLVVSTGICADTATQQVSILPPLPTASFVGSGEGCAPLTVSFTNTSLLGAGYQWQFGDGATSIAENPVHEYHIPGTYTVQLTVFGVNGGVNTAIKVDSVVVHPSAMAFFTLQPEQVVAPTQPLFTYNLSTNASGYIWDFGDGTYSNETSPLHYYQNPGTYDVSLIANNMWNCPDTFSVPGAVSAIAGGEIIFPNAFTPGNTGPSDGVYDPNSIENDIFHPLSKGVVDYKLQIFNRWGELLFETLDIHKGWDGYYRGQLSKQDVYVWKAYARFVTGEEKRMSGDLTLLR